MQRADEMPDMITIRSMGVRREEGKMRGGEMEEAGQGSTEGVKVRREGAGKAFPIALRQSTVPLQDLSDKQWLCP